MASLNLLLLLLLPFGSCRVMLQKPSVSRDTLFDSVTEEAYASLEIHGLLPKDNRADPLNLTAVMQLSILSGSVENVAWLLTEYDDARALGLGFKFPRVLRERALRTTAERTLDGDVVSLKGMATAALKPALAKRLTEVYIFAAYGEPFLDRVCTTEEPAVFDDEGVPDCHIAVILDFIRERMVEAFEDTEDMKRIIAANPDVNVLGFEGVELSKANVNVSSWPCAYCFETDFCLAHAINCPYESEEDLALSAGGGPRESIGCIGEPDDDNGSSESPESGLDEFLPFFLRVKSGMNDSPDTTPEKEALDEDVYSYLESDVD